MCLAQPGKYLFLTANMIAVSVCKHSQSRCMKIFGHNGPCHHLMARKKYYQTYQWKRPRVSIVVLFLIDTHVIEYRLVGQRYLFGVIAYLIFVNFGTPPHYLGLKKYNKKSANLRQNNQNWPKYPFLCAKKYTGLKKYTTASSGSRDKYEQCNVWKR